MEINKELRQYFSFTKPQRVTNGFLVGLCNGKGEIGNKILGTNFCVYSFMTTLDDIKINKYRFNGIDIVTYTIKGIFEGIYEKREQNLESIELFKSNVFEQSTNLENAVLSIDVKLKVNHVKPIEDDLVEINGRSDIEIIDYIGITKDWEIIQDKHVLTLGGEYLVISNKLDQNHFIGIGIGFNGIFELSDNINSDDLIKQKSPQFNYLQNKLLKKLKG